LADRNEAANEGLNLVRGLVLGDTRRRAGGEGAADAPALPVAALTGGTKAPPARLRVRCDLVELAPRLGSYPPGRVHFPE